MKEIEREIGGKSYQLEVEQLPAGNFMAAYEDTVSFGHTEEEAIEDCLLQLKETADETAIARVEEHNEYQREFYPQKAINE